MIITREYEFIFESNNNNFARFILRYEIQSALDIVCYLGIDHHPVVKKILR